MNLLKDFFIFRKTVVILFVVMTSFIIFSYINAQTQTGKIIVQVNGFKNSNGNARFLLFSTNEKNYFPSKQDKAFAKFIVPIKSNKAQFTFENLPYGDYAVCVHHDEDNNNKVNTNWLGIPNEGLGASNDAKGNFGPPSFEKAKITLNKEELTIIINIVN